MPQDLEPEEIVAAPALLLVNAQVAADALGIGRSKLYELMGQGRLPFVLIGRSRRIPLAALRRFVHEETQRQGFVL